MKTKKYFSVIFLILVACLISSACYSADAKSNKNDTQKKNLNRLYKDIFAEAKKAVQPCDAYAFTTPQQVTNDEAKMIGTLKDRNNISVVIEGSYLTFDGCVDVNGDGIPEAAISNYNRYCGGRPCSFTYVYASEGHSLKLMGSPIGDEFGEDLTFKDLNGDGKMEVLTYVTWAYWGDLDYNDSPVLPKILCYRKNDFEDCTKEFPQIINKEIKESLKAEIHNEKENNLNEAELQYIRGQALRYLALHHILGKEKEGWKGAKKLFPSAYSWLKDEWNK